MVVNAESNATPPKRRSRLIFWSASFSNFKLNLKLPGTRVCCSSPRRNIITIWYRTDCLDLVCQCKSTNREQQMSDESRVGSFISPCHVVFLQRRENVFAASADLLSSATMNLRQLSYRTDAYYSRGRGRTNNIVDNCNILLLQIIVLHV
jgi:hypothetical protein